ncbi:MAG: crossover junction endodeoxyribonuclease RuvC [Planctomycetes bacterium]|nr:crossover junction endodeoxyribonuclease RuvC [Planctomycetota bacterium]
MIPPTRVLGIDPGTLRVGWAVVTKSGNTFRALAWGVIRARGPLTGRLLQIYDGLTAVAREHRPHVLALEDVFYGKDIRAMEKIGEGRAIAKLVAAQCGMPVSEYPPATVKKSVAGHGGASKEAVSRMIVAAFGLSETPRPADVSDALALGLCHCTRGEEAVASPRRRVSRRGWTTADVQRLASGAR